MVVEPIFSSVTIPAFAGLAMSVLLERFMTPQPPLERPWAAWALHAGCWLSAYGAWVLLLGRPWFALAVVMAIFLTLVFVNNAKMKALREPFVFQDYEYFTDAIRHPRLYIPFLGWWRFLGAATGFALAVTIGFLGEAAPVHRFIWSGQMGGIAVVASLGMGLLLIGNWKRPCVSFDPMKDVLALGFLSSIWCYGQKERESLVAASPFDPLVPKNSTKDLPHLVAVQSESFFDARELFPGIRRDVLRVFDQTKAEAVMCGKLEVPAWGANTVRTEFSFLSGMDNEALGVHRFNPYRAVAAGRNVASLACFLKRLGYRTVCVHPYPASFYRRDRVYPRLGFDEFIDISAFGAAKRFGPYIGDASVADQIAVIVKKSSTPVFVFAITMENHGPLHLERVEPSDVDAFYTQAPPENCEDLTIYLRHLRNADRMLASLRKMLEESGSPAHLCWFGDHVPIMPEVYKKFGTPNGLVEYVLWSNHPPQYQKQDDIVVSNLAMHWLRVAGLVAQ